MYQIKNISEVTKNLISTIEKDGGSVDEELIQAWIEDILESIDSNHLVTVTYYLLRNEKNKENLLKVYSYVNERFEEKMKSEKIN